MYPTRIHPILSLLAWLAGWFILSGDTAKAAPPPTSGGPDAFGYVYTDSRATEVPPGFPDKPVYDWEEIGPGDQRGIKLPTVKDLANNAVGYGIISLGFPFRFYDNVYDSLWIYSEGVVSFNGALPTPREPYENPQTLPNAAAPNNLIAALWANHDIVLGDGNVWYKYAGTPGSVDQRVIIQYDDVQVWNRTQTATFQIKIFAGSRIEIHYKDIPNTNLTTNYTIGIENADGSQGLEYLHGALSSLDTDLLPGTAVRIERSVPVEVESEFGSSAGGSLSKLTPAVGFQRFPFASKQRFEAPEFIYLNQYLEELDEIGDYNDPDPSKIAHYRARNLGASVDGADTQTFVAGAERFFEPTVTGPIKVIWKWDLEYAVFIESATGDGGFGNPQSSWEGRTEAGIGRVWVPKDAEFAAAIDSTVTEEAAGFRFRNRGYQLTRPKAGTIERVRSPAGIRAVTDNLVVDDWMRIKWLWEGQARYRFDAQVSLPGSTDVLNDHAFLQVSRLDATETLADAGGGSWVNPLVVTQAKTFDEWVERGAAQGLSKQWLKVASSADGKRLVAAEDSGIYISVDSGNSWSPRTNAPGMPADATWTSVASSADGKILLAGSLATFDQGGNFGGGKIFLSTDFGNNWTAPGGVGGVNDPPWSDVACSADGSVMVVVSVAGGGLYFSTDSGVSWLPRTAAHGLAAFDQFTSVAASDDGSNLLAATSGTFGTVYRSSDSGASWTRLGDGATLPAASWKSVASSADGYRLAAVSRSIIRSGKIYLSGDSGATWTQRGATHGLPADSDWRSIASSADG